MPLIFSRVEILFVPIDQALDRIVVLFMEEEASWLNLNNIIAFKSYLDVFFYE